MFKRSGPKPRQGMVADHANVVSRLSRNSLCASPSQCPAGSIPINIHQHNTPHLYERKRKSQARLYEREKPTKQKTSVPHIILFSGDLSSRWIGQLVWNYSTPLSQHDQRRHSIVCFLLLPGCGAMDSTTGSHIPTSFFKGLY